ncbi:lysine-rich arabinogalactan protein 19-like [Hibiscus syriacus]|uniref:lysine-rich arabinogalactan protein 19-like n=1 Tax=Hibiscus syriacus TaxID=106335 RepID=UPI001924126A|nr:lysine-rich arabinogalactan protein 19-like [Hibiscus syriacus]
MEIYFEYVKARDMQINDFFKELLPNSNIRLSTFPAVILKYKVSGSTFHTSTSHAPPDVPPEIPVDVTPLATQVPPVPEEGQDEDLTPEPPQPEHDPTQSPICPPPPVPVVATSPAPIPAKPTPTTEQSTPARTSPARSTTREPQAVYFNHLLLNQQQ